MNKNIYHKVPGIMKATTSIPSSTQTLKVEQASKVGITSTLVLPANLSYTLWGISNLSLPVPIIMY